MVNTYNRYFIILTVNYSDMMMLDIIFFSLVQLRG